MIKKNKGFTLIELILTIAISGIIFASAIVVIPYTSKLTSAANEITQAQNLANMKMQAIEYIIRYAKTLDISSAKPVNLNANYTSLYIDSGKIKTCSYDGIPSPITSDAGFEDYTYTVSFSPYNTQVVKVNLSVFRNSVKLYDISSSIYASNLISGSITGITGGACLSYKMPTEPVSSIIVTSPVSNINTSGQTLQMSAEVYPVKATNKGVAWSVDNTDYASITQDGLLTPLKNEVVTVKATALDGTGVYGTKMISISNQNITITSLTLTTSTGGTRLEEGGRTMTIIPNIVPFDATNTSLIWTVDNPSIATIDQNGVLTSNNADIANTSVMVSAATQDGSKIEVTIEIRITT